MSRVDADSNLLLWNNATTLVSIDNHYLILKNVWIIYYEVNFKFFHGFGITVAKIFWVTRILLHLYLVVLPVH